MNVAGSEKGDRVRCTKAKVSHCKGQHKPVGCGSEISSCGDQIDNKAVSSDYDNRQKPTEDREPKRQHPRLYLRHLSFLK